MCEQYLEAASITLPYNWISYLDLECNHFRLSLRSLFLLGQLLPLRRHDVGLFPVLLHLGRLGQLSAQR